MIKLGLMQTLFIMLFNLEHFNIQGEGKESQCPDEAEIMKIRQPILYVKYKCNVCLLACTCS